MTKRAGCAEIHLIAYLSCYKLYTLCYPLDTLGSGNNTFNLVVISLIWGGAVIDSVYMVFVNNLYAWFSPLTMSCESSEFYVSTDNNKIHYFVNLLQ